MFGRSGKDEKDEGVLLLGAGMHWAPTRREDRDELIWDNGSARVGEGTLGVREWA
jgi:hypothetical protein